MNEDLTKATHSMMFVVGSLQDALKRANAVEALVLVNTIKAAVKVQQRIEALAAAIEMRNQSERPIRNKNSQ